MLTKNGFPKEYNDESEYEDDDDSDIMVAVNIVDWLPAARPASCHHTRDIDSIFYPNITIANVIIITITILLMSWSSSSQSSS